MPGSDSNGNVSGCLRVATRGSDLALAQSGRVTAALRAAHPGLEIEVVTIKTAGDRDRASALWKMPGMGFFTTQVEQALLEGRADVAVHSFKDMPTQPTPGLTLTAISRRRWPEDAVVAQGRLESLDALPAGAVVGTSSPRRIALMRTLRPDMRIEPIRGNVPTRLRKVDKGHVDAVIVARAGLERLGMADRISLVLDPTVFTPAAAQGALAIQCRADDAKTAGLLRAVDDGPTRVLVEAERAVLAGLHPGCHAPVGVYAAFEGEGTMRIWAFLADMEAERVIRKELCGPTETAGQMAQEMIRQILDAGGAEILESMGNV